MNYKTLLKQYESLLIGKLLPDMANTSAFLFENIPNLNWVGFYLQEDDKLFLGPFQGKVACTTIPLGKGVCGTVALSKKTMYVPNVHEIENHITCDTNSNSEVVVPIMLNNAFLGVLDIDSPVIARFENSEDIQFFEEIIHIFRRTQQQHSSKQS